MLAGWSYLVTDGWSQLALSASAAVRCLYLVSEASTSRLSWRRDEVGFRTNQSVGFSAFLNVDIPSLNRIRSGNAVYCKPMCTRGRVAYIAASVSVICRVSVPDEAIKCEARSNFKLRGPLQNRTDPYYTLLVSQKNAFYS